MAGTFEERRHPLQVYMDDRGELVKHVARAGSQAYEDRASMP